MVFQLKRLLYFPIASYFRFFAAIRLQRWHPRIVVVTGSNGKTTLLHMLESQIGGKAKYSHHANSAFGIPFDILDLQRKTLLKTEWIGLFLQAPFHAFKNPPKENLYIVEADVDRPGEGKFLGELLRPEVVLLASISKTHSMNFDKLVEQKKFSHVEDAIAYEFGYFLEYCQKLAVINGADVLEASQKDRTKAEIRVVIKSDLQKYELKKDGTLFAFAENTYRFPFLFPEEIFYTISMCKMLTEYLDIPFDPKFSRFSPPPGRGSVFQGIKDIMIVDSCYNANLASMTAIIAMYEKFPGDEKWAVIGDMLEQGNGEKEEHEKLAELLAKQHFKRIIFLGPRVKKYTYPKLQSLSHEKISLDVFLNPREVLDFILAKSKGGETILFKGARFMEGIIENILKDKKDVAKLSRREKIWEIRRKQWGL